MHVAVAGGAGDLGSAITHAFHLRGVPTFALVHPRTNASRLADLPETVIHRVDLVDTDGLTDELRRYDDLVVVNAVGRSGHPDTPVAPTGSRSGGTPCSRPCRSSTPSTPIASGASCTSAARSSTDPPTTPFARPTPGRR